MRLLDFYNPEELFERSEIKMNGFIEIDNAPISISWAIAKFDIIANLPINYFPKNNYNSVETIKKFCESERLLSVQVDEKVETTSIYGLPIIDRPTIYDLITKYQKFPAHKYLSKKSIDIRKEVTNATKLRALERFFTNLGQVYYSHLLESLSKPSEFGESNAHSYTHIYENLVADKILRKGVKSDLPLLLNYKTKEQLINIIENRNQNLKVNNLSKKKLIELLLKEPELYEIELHNQFFLLNYDYQNLKMWIQKENVYRKLFSILTDELELSYILIPDVLKELIERNKDYKTAIYLIQIFLSNLHHFRGVDEFTVEKIKKQYKKLEKRIE